MMKEQKLSHVVGSLTWLSRVEDVHRVHEERASHIP
jgi:hypothetical protein